MAVSRSRMDLRRTSVGWAVITGVITAPSRNRRAAGEARSDVSRSSGLGSRHGAGGIRKYCSQQAILVSRLNPKRDVHMFPYNAKMTKRLQSLFKFLYGRGKRD